MSKTLTVRSPQEMEALGEELAKGLSGGDVILLTGELGAGKTVLCKGIAKGLGITVPVVSPTFTIMNEYISERAVFCHFDAYRLGNEDEAYGAGLTDFIGSSDCICAVEWWQNIGGLFYGCNTIRITIDKTANDIREVKIER